MNRCRAHGSTKPFLRARNAESARFVTRPLPPLPPERPTSRAQREREAKAYWDSLTEAQEVWALRKMGFFRLGEHLAPVRAHPDQAT